jgi:hypothetical protein
MPPLANASEQTADALSNELLILIESTAGEFVDPAKRVACGVRLYLHAARDYPAFAQAVAATGPPCGRFQQPGARVPAAAPLLRREHRPVRRFTARRDARDVIFATRRLMHVSAWPGGAPESAS